MVGNKANSHKIHNPGTRKQRQNIVKTTIMSESTVNIKPQLRFQVLQENKPGQQIQEFKAADLAELTYDAFAAHVSALAFPLEQDPEQLMTSFKYRQVEEHDESRWVYFKDTEGLNFAIQSNQSRGIVFVSAFVETKGASLLFSGSEEPAGTAVVDATANAVKARAVKKTNTSAKHSKPSSSLIANGLGSSVEQRILAALKELRALGIADPPRKQVALFSGYSNVQSKSFANALSKLSTQGLVKYPDSKLVCLTEEGAVQAGPVTTPTSNHVVQERLKNFLQPKAIEIFNTLSDGLAHLREDVAAATGYTNVHSKSF